MRTRTTIAVCLLSLVASAAIASQACAAPAPSWQLQAKALPSHFAPGATMEDDFTEYYLQATNVGGAQTNGPITFAAVLPTGLNPVKVNAADRPGEQSTCVIEGQTVTCVNSGAKSIPPGSYEKMEIGVDVEAGLPEGSIVATQWTVSGGGATAATITAETPIDSAPAAFDLPAGAAAGGLAARASGVDGQPVTQAGSHPFQLTIDLGLPIKKANGRLQGVGGGVRNLRAVLPKGFVLNPSATPVRCTEAELEADSTGGGCPDASQIGTVNVLISLVGTGADPQMTPLYNMVPPPGSAASLGFNAAGVGAYQHILGGVREGDYALVGDSRDLLARPGNPVMAVEAQLWGDPSSSIHNATRRCANIIGGGGVCPVLQQTGPLLSMPSACAESTSIEASADSWLDPGHFFEAAEALRDPVGNATGVSGCNALSFAPTLKARPTTNVADSPSGLEVDLHVPQTNSLETLATAHLRTAVVTLPEGLSVNPSSANGLAACSSAQIGLKSPIGATPIRFNGAQPSCPDASRIGSVEVDTPLLDHSLPGSVYIASPHDNPFDSLLAIYVVVNDPRSGVVVKLAGHVEADPRTGRLRTTFDEGPQVPFEDFKLQFFGGAAAALRTPATCGTYSTTSEMTPWSAPESGPPATPSDSYAISQGPGGGCASSQSALPNTPTFDAGSASPIAGAYSPFVVNLRRNDGSQRFSTVTLTPPPGLLGKLAGTTYCPEAALAAAAGKTGNAEKANPSCPASSRVGTVTVGAGAGPAPYYTQGAAYLTGPYKGARLGMAIVTPATAGPYDLGTVVVRTALHVDPETVRITAVSDPIPEILEGIPLDVRSAQIALDRPDFTVNPTSCNPFTVSGQLVSTLGQAAALSSRYQVAECGRLAFKPKLSLSLKGGTKRGANPALKAVLTMPGGGSNIARASVALPHSEFLDQSHIKTICTRVQFAAGACPAGSIYGQAQAFTPLLDAPLEGPVYLRSSSHPLPDLVADLGGQIHVVLAGRIDSVKGGIRNTFEAVPDAPVSKFVLTMQGGNKGLLQNSTNLCKSTNRATVEFDGQNGKIADFKPVLKSSCKSRKKADKKRSRHHGGR